MILPKTKSATHCLTKLFTVYQKNIGPSNGRTDRSIVPATHRPIVPLYYIEDCQICNLGTNMANSFHTLWNKINLFVLAQTCYSKHLVYVERQRREHAIKLQSFPEYDVPLWSFMNVNEMTMFILLFDYILKWRAFHSDVTLMPHNGRWR